MTHGAITVSWKYGDQRRQGGCRIEILTGHFLILLGLSIEFYGHVTSTRDEKKHKHSVNGGNKNNRVFFTCTPQLLTMRNHSIVVKFIILHNINCKTSTVGHTLRTDGAKKFSHEDQRSIYNMVRLPIRSIIILFLKISLLKKRKYSSNVAKKC